jgi:hypothetical protein
MCGHISIGYDRTNRLILPVPVLAEPTLMEGARESTKNPTGKEQDFRGGQKFMEKPTIREILDDYSTQSVER